MSHHRYFLSLAYDGSAYHGWQRQPNGITVQQRLEEAMTLIMRTPVSLTGCGRTDTGVHAAEYYAHFDFDAELLPPAREKLVFKLNSYLGGDIVLAAIVPVTLQAHARFSATSRTYHYCVARKKDPFRRNFTYYIYGELDVDLMNRAAERLMEYDDFTSFSKVDTDTKTNICRVSAAYWRLEGMELVFTITADRFLRNMVRAIVGTLLQIGTGKISPDELISIIEGKNRSDAGDSVPAKGLVLARVTYPDGIFLVSR
jgi:tRNA pseudouridine38-40 synthase